MNLRFSFYVQLTLRTREQVRASILCTVRGGRDYDRAILNPFRSLAPAEEKIRADLQNKVQAKTNRWALTLSEAQDVFDAGSYRELEIKLSAIASDLFTVQSVQVAEIVPASPARPTEPPKKSRAREVIERLQEDTEGFDLIREEHVKVKAKYPDLFQDGSKFGDRANARWQQKALKVFFGGDE